MEPSFLATPYLLASAPSSAEIRALLDQQEACYLEWRRQRKPMRHAFASLKLNRASRLSPVERRAGAVPAPAPTPTSVPPRGSGKRKDAIQLGSGRAAPPVPPSRLELPPVAGEALEPSAELERELAGRDEGGPSRLPLEERAARGSRAAAGARARAEEALAARPAPALRQAFRGLQPYLHAYYSRQVFSLASTAPASAEPGAAAAAEAEARPEQRAGGGAESPAVAAPAAQEPSPRESAPADALVVAGLALARQSEYDAVFAQDWAASGARKAVRDAVDRERVARALCGGYRVLLWFFRYSAGAAAAAAGPAAWGGTRLFEAPSARALLADLGVAGGEAADAPAALADAPLRRERLVDFALAVARLRCAPPRPQQRLSARAADGVELSEAVRAVMRDHVAAFAQVQDVNHFRNVFLRDRGGAGGRDDGDGGGGGDGGGDGDGESAGGLRQLLDAHAGSLSALFEELAAASGGAPPGVGCAQFVALLHALGVAAGSAAGSAATPDAPASEAAAAAAAAAGVEDARAVRIFLSSLPLAPGSRALRRPQLVEALLRAALAWRERAVCRGRYDVCPGQLASDACACRPETAGYALGAFRAAVAELLARVVARRLARSQTQARGRRREAAAV